jgi:hypothetical protein
MPFQDKTFVEPGLPIQADSLVYYADCRWKVQRAQRTSGKHWVIQAFDVNDVGSTRWFHNLGERRGNEIDWPKGGKLLIVSEPEIEGQMTMELF